VLVRRAQHSREVGGHAHAGSCVGFPDTGDTLGPVREQAVAAYLAMWHDDVIAARTADYRSVALARDAAGQALTLLVSGLRQQARNGIVILGAPALDPHATSVTVAHSVTTVTVTDCADGSRWLQYAQSGARAGNGPAGRHKILASVQGIDGTWRVASLDVQGPSTCLTSPRPSSSP